MAQRPLARPTARASRSGHSARWSAGGAGLLETDDEATTRAEGRLNRRPSSSPTTRARWIETALLTLLGVESRAGRRPAVRRLAHVLRAHRREGHGRPGLRGHPVRRLRPARLRRPPARLEQGAADLRHHARAARADRAAPELGRGQAQLRRRWPSSRCAKPPCASCWPASCPACPERASRRSSPAPTAFRSTPLRRSACSSPKAGCVEEDGVVHAGGRPDRAAVPGRR